MSKADTNRTLEQVGLGLALMEDECLYIPAGESTPYHQQVTIGVNCPKCHGTGKVARFPMLRRQCHNGHFVEERRRTVRPYVEEAVGHYSHEGCGVCQGRSWVPVTTEEALLEAAATQKYEIYRACLEALLDWYDDRVGTQAERIALALEAAKKQEAQNAH